MKGVIFSAGMVALARLAPHECSGAFDITVRVRTGDGAALPDKTILPRRKKLHPLMNAGSLWVNISVKSLVNFPDDIWINTIGTKSISGCSMDKIQSNSVLSNYSFGDTCYGLLALPFRPVMQACEVQGANAFQKFWRVISH